MSLRKNIIRLKNKEKCENVIREKSNSFKKQRKNVKSSLGKTLIRLKIKEKCENVIFEFVFIFYTQNRSLIFT